MADRKDKKGKKAKEEESSSEGDKDSDEDESEEKDSEDEEDEDEDSWAEDEENVGGQHKRKGWVQRKKSESEDISVDTPHSATTQDEFLSSREASTPLASPAVLPSPSLNNNSHNNHVNNNNNNNNNTTTTTTTEKNKGNKNKQTGWGFLTVRMRKKKPPIDFPPTPTTTPSPAPTPVTKPAPAKKKKKGWLSSLLGKEKPADLTLSGPSSFRHESHIGWNQETGFDLRNIPQDWKKLFVAAGVKKADLADGATAKMIVDTVSATTATFRNQQGIRKMSESPQGLSPFNLRDIDEKEEAALVGAISTVLSARRATKAQQGEEDEDDGSDTFDSDDEWSDGDFSGDQLYKPKTIPGSNQKKEEKKNKNNNTSVDKNEGEKEQQQQTLRSRSEPMVAKPDKTAPFKKERSSRKGSSPAVGSHLKKKGDTEKSKLAKENGG